MEDPKPLHVRVAEALGCKPFLSGGGEWWDCSCADEAHLGPHDRTDPGSLAEYDTDWSATGPLIEKYGITLLGWGDAWTAGLLEPHTYFNEVGVVDGGLSEHADGPTALLAVCNLLLALAEAGKLKVA